MSNESISPFEEIGREIPAYERPTIRQKKGYFPGFPLWVVRVVVEAKAVRALPLVLAIHRQMVMTKETTIPLTGAVWDAAGSPDKQERVAVMRNLRKLRKIFRLSAKQTPFSYYRVTRGPLWDKAGERRTQA
jgi:hypothetical protein